MNIIDTIQQEQIKKDVTSFKVGDSVRVHTRVIEGEKERIQIFTGIVIGRKGTGLNANFTVRRISYGEGVERVFPVNSPRIAKIEVETAGTARRSKLNYLRGPQRQAGDGRPRITLFSPLRCAARSNMRMHCARPVSAGSRGSTSPGAAPLRGRWWLPRSSCRMFRSHAVVDDSKKLTAEQREEIYAAIIVRTDVFWAVAVVEHEEIDRFNILRATHEAMRRAVQALSTMPEHALIDGLPVRPFPVPHTAIVQGDGRCKSIAAASILAKVTRDRIMVRMDAEYPSYGFAQHKGYATELHLERLKAHGPCPIHRKTFLPVAEQLLPL